MEWTTVGRTLCSLTARMWRSRKDGPEGEHQKIKALRSHTLRLLGPKTIPYKAFEAIWSPGG